MSRWTEHGNDTVRAILELAERYDGDIPKDVADRLGRLILPHVDPETVTSELASIADDVWWADQLDARAGEAARDYYDAPVINAAAVADELLAEKQRDAIRCAELLASLNAARLVA